MKRGLGGQPVEEQMGVRWDTWGGRSWGPWAYVQSGQDGRVRNGCEWRQMDRRTGEEPGAGGLALFLLSTFHLFIVIFPLNQAQDVGRRQTPGEGIYLNRRQGEWGKEHFLGALSVACVPPCTSPHLPPQAALTCVPTASWALLPAPSSPVLDAWPPSPRSARLALCSGLCHSELCHVRQALSPSGPQSAHL